ncbi:Hypothetical predicted protein [Paramuricea clavata]|uniref:Uncharacterized protein n=1 Tax=Paramuricea clavata TaxID=317549 RepID=A0A7D9HVN4_PARCT|nr:Hypothetical predicted protein [Paramuricea clavata]
MSKIFRRKGLALLSGILCLLATGIIVTVLINDPHKPETRPWSAWVQANFTRTIQVNGVNQVLAKTGWVYFGLFKGYKEKSYSGNYQGLRTEYFEVFKEFDNVFNLKILYAVIGCLVVGGIVLILSAGLSFYNEFTKSSYVILGSVGLYIFNGVAFFFMLCAVGLFSGLYHQQIKKNVLKSSEIDEGFNSEDNASLKFSFWILVGACFLPLINMLLTFLNSARAKSYFNKTTTIPTSNVDGMMLY